MIERYNFPCLDAPDMYQPHLLNWARFHDDEIEFIGFADFTESRQFRKNLEVSKYKDNPHWLSNYTWKPPEKFNGTRSVV